MKQPESIILSFANMGNAYLDHLYYELNVIEQALKSVIEKNLIKVIENNGARLQSLTTLLTSEQGNSVTMLHYSGHSDHESLIVQWQDKKGSIKSELISDLVKIHKKFRLIFLNSCYSEHIAQELIKAGVPYVIGTTTMITDKQAAIVAGQFYHFLARTNKNIKDAFTLTKMYFADPSYNDNAGIKEAFRSFDLTDAEETATYPWKLFENPQLKEEDRTWVLVPLNQNSKTPLTAAALMLIVAIALLTWFFSPYPRKEITKNNKTVDTANNSKLKEKDSIIATPPKNIVTRSSGSGKRFVTGSIINPGALSVAGNVYDEYDKPLSGVDVIVNGVSADISTDKNGWFTYTFDFPQLKNEYTIKFIKAGYQPYTETDALPKNNVSIFLKQSN